MRGGGGGGWSTYARGLENLEKRDWSTCGTEHAANSIAEKSDLNLWHKEDFLLLSVYLLGPDC